MGRRQLKRSFKRNFALFAAMIFVLDKQDRRILLKRFGLVIESK